MVFETRGQGDCRREAYSDNRASGISPRRSWVARPVPQWHGLRSEQTQRRMTAGGWPHLKLCRVCTGPIAWWSLLLGSDRDFGSTSELMNVAFLWIYLFLAALPLCCCEKRLLSGCGPSLAGGARALGRGSVAAAPQQVRSSRTRWSLCALPFGRQILNHWTTRVPTMKVSFIDLIHKLFTKPDFLRILFTLSTNCKLGPLTQVIFTLSWFLIMEFLF